MSQDNGQQTERWARLLVDQLVKQGVRYFCLSPGSRNTPLLLAVAERSDVQTMVHFDERGMAFHALGVAKATGSPVVLITTSGTAVGNLLPALMEASAAFVPLIIVTADRPPELRDNGANQTTIQPQLFAHLVRWQGDVPAPECALSDHYMATTVAQAVYRSMYGHKGPVHLNVMLREPFFSNKPPLLPTDFTTHYESPIVIPATSTLERWAERLSGIEKGLIVMGSLPSNGPRESLYKLAERLNWPILADVISGGRADGPSPHTIAYYESIIKAGIDLKPDAILHFGDRLSRVVLDWIESISPSFYGLITDHPSRHDPKHNITHRIQCSPEIFCSAILPYICQTKNSSWFEKWKEASTAVSENLDLFFSKQPSFSEPGITRLLSSELRSNQALFLSNSMPVRYADNFLFPAHSIGPVFCNRGVSGIDGNIATAIGIAQGARMPVVALLGDLAALHDINSLAQLKQSAYPVIFLVLNNGGGGIFSFLPVAEKKGFEKYIATAHDLDFENAARLFDVPYYFLTESENWEKSLAHLIHAKKSCLVEVRTNRKENHQLHLKLTEGLKNLCCLTV
jgi:2-succinyl-5-enolpyruvyl-6-hydroxy-3-cyclohexene-1-carboxylate synthase